MDETFITPIHKVNEYNFKREDLFTPYGANDVNGGKLRQCIMLIKGLNFKPKRVITYCSIHSPQAPIVSAVCENLSIPCVVLYGGTKEENLKKMEMPILARKHGCDIKIVSKFGRHNVLHKIANDMYEDGDFIVQYGINLCEHEDALLGAVSNQVQNIPNEIDNLYMVCGSGITAIGVMVGIKKYNKNVKNVHLFCTAPDRSNLINETLKRYNALREYILHPLFGSKGFVYEKGVKYKMGDISFHPNYEAKMMQYMTNNGIFKKDNNLIWITGSKPIVVQS